MKKVMCISTMPESDKSTQEHFAEVYRQIGIHFINNAERLGNNVIEGTSGVDIFISLEPNSVVSIDISQKEVLMKQGLLAGATFGILQVDETIKAFNEKLTEKMEELTNE